MSRHQQTPARLLLELNADATDYIPAVETDQACGDFPPKWEVLRMVLEDAPQQLTRRDILLEWPEDFDQPDPGTLARWLNRALACQSILREGSGRKSDPFRYWLPEKIAQWREDNPCYDIVEVQTLLLKLPFVALHEKKTQKSFDFDADSE